LRSQVRRSVWPWSRRYGIVFRHCCSLHPLLYRRPWPRSSTPRPN
jgi:hypothetical protein